MGLGGPWMGWLCPTDHKEQALVGLGGPGRACCVPQTTRSRHWWDWTNIPAVGAARAAADGTRGVFIAGRHQFMRLLNFS